MQSHFNGISDKVGQNVVQFQSVALLLLPSSILKEIWNKKMK